MAQQLGQRLEVELATIRLTIERAILRRVHLANESI